MTESNKEKEGELYLSLWIYYVPVDLWYIAASSFLVFNCPLISCLSTLLFTFCIFKACKMTPFLNHIWGEKLIFISNKYDIDQNMCTKLEITLLKLIIEVLECCP